MCLTSPNGVRLLFDRLYRAGRDARALGDGRVAAIGPGTAAALRQHGVIADVVPERFVAEGLVEALAGVPVTSGADRPGCARRATCCPTRCASAAPRSTSLELYETVAEPMSERQRQAVARRRLRDVHLVLHRALLL